MITLYKVENLLSRAIADRIKRDVQSIHGVESVTVDLNMHEVTVTHMDAVTIKYIVYKLEELGCPLVVPFASKLLDRCVFSPPYSSLN
jgi:copper chaperone CopZ